jgi:protein O-mannosyl-transferase
MIRRWYPFHPFLSFALLSGVLTFTLYAKALNGPFVYDDIGLILNNPSLGSMHAIWIHFILEPVSFTNRFRGIGGSFYRPILWLSIALDNRVWGLDHPGRFHLTNVALHWMNGLLLFSFFRRLIPLHVSFLGICIWLALPINTDAVAWISGRSYLLCTLFVLLSLNIAFLYVKYRTALAAGGYFVVAIAALLSNEAGIFLFPLLLITLLCLTKTSFRIIGTLAGLTIAADFVYLVARILVHVQRTEGPINPLDAGLVFFQYFQWMFLPVRMSIERSTSLPLHPSLIVAITAWSGVILFFAGLRYLWKTHRELAIGLAWTGLVLIPYCGFVFIYQGMAERYLYLASVGFAIAVASSITWAGRNWTRVAAAGCAVWMIWGIWRLESRLND